MSKLHALLNKISVFLFHFILKYVKKYHNTFQINIKCDCIISYHWTTAVLDQDLFYMEVIIMKFETISLFAGYILGIKHKDNFFSHDNLP